MNQQLKIIYSRRDVQKAENLKFEQKYDGVKGKFVCFAAKKVLSVFL